jgi:hypothetical protein
MSVMDSLKFWKKKEEQPAGAPIWNDLEQPRFDTAPPGMEEPQMPSIPSLTPPPLSMSQTATASQSPGLTSRDVELILAKLDAVKAQLEGLNARMAHLERIAEGTQPPKGW